MEKKKSNKWSLIPIIIIVALVPLVMGLNILTLSEEAQRLFRTPTMVDLFDKNKSILILCMTLVMLFFGGFYTREVRLSIQQKIYYYAGLVFAVMVLVSALFSDYREIAFMGMPGRSEGALVLISYILMMWYTMNHVEDISGVKVVVIALGIATIGNTILGISQYIGKDLIIHSSFLQQLIVPDSLIQYRGSLSPTVESWVYGALDNPNYVGSFVAVVIPIFMITVFAAKGWGGKILAAVALIGGNLLMIGCRSDAGMLGVGVATVLALLVFARWGWHHKVGTLTIALLCIGLLVGANITTKGVIGNHIIDFLNSLKVSDSKRNEEKYGRWVTITDIALEENRLIMTNRQKQLVMTYEADALSFRDGDGVELVATRADANKEQVYIISSEGFNNIQFRILSFKKEDYIVVDVPQGRLVSLKIVEHALQYADVVTESTIPSVVAPYVGFEGLETIGSGRGYIWSRSIPMLKGSLIVGNGADTYGMKFPQYDVLMKWQGLYRPDIVVDKVHNMYLQFAIDNGVVAVVALLVLFLAYMVDSLRLYGWKQYYSRQMLVGVALLLGVVGYLIAALFNDSVVGVAPVFWVILGCGMGINRLNRKQQPIPSASVVSDKTLVTATKEIEDIGSMYEDLSDEDFNS